MPGNYYKPGAWNIRCMICDRKIKSTEIKKRWDGIWCCPEDWEPRHPLDFLRGVPERITVPFNYSGGITYDGPIYDSWSVLGYGDPSIPGTSGTINGIPADDNIFIPIHAGKSPDGYLASVVQTTVVSTGDTTVDIQPVLYTQYVPPNESTFVSVALSDLVISGTQPNTAPVVGLTAEVSGQYIVMSPVTDGTSTVPDSFDLVITFKLLTTYTNSLGNSETGTPLFVTINYVYQSSAATSSIITQLVKTTVGGTLDGVIVNGDEVTNTDGDLFTLFGNINSSDTIQIRRLANQFYSDLDDPTAYGEQLFSFRVDDSTTLLQAYPTAIATATSTEGNISVVEFVDLEPTVLYTTLIMGIQQLRATTGKIVISVPETEQVLLTLNFTDPGPDSFQDLIPSIRTFGIEVVSPNNTPQVDVFGGNTYSYYTLSTDTLGGTIGGITLSTITTFSDPYSIPASSHLDDVVLTSTTIGTPGDALLRLTTPSGFTYYSVVSTTTDIDMITPLLADAIGRRTYIDSTDGGPRVAVITPPGAGSFNIQDLQYEVSNYYTMCLNADATNIFSRVSLSNFISLTTIPTTYTSATFFPIS